MTNINRKFFSKIGLNYTFFGVFAIIMQIIIINIIGFANPIILNDINLTSIIASVCNYILPLPIFLYLMNKLEKQEIHSNKLTIKKFIVYIAISLTLMWVGNLIGLTITEILGNLIQSEIANPIVETIDSSSVYTNLLLMVIMAPIFEEIIFRKLLIDRTIKYGKGVSILLSALIFGLFHGNLNQFFYAFLIGGFFAYVYIKTGKIIYTILLHLTVNFFGSIISVIVGNSLNNMNTMANLPIADAGIIIIYFLIYVLIVIVGVIGLLKNYKKISLLKDNLIKKPYTTSLINVGMICFYIYVTYIFLM
ncbi:CAAX amino terminal protease self- immunity [Methanobrevibacter woesei]|uniref:CAAX amino terminal protease self-immunity n=1 Tax=Methanobrevibacter woesei TaxID=190976 RepID=A0A2U1S9I7_9EURY|nr:CPBP family intramembrane glutamic endopeptidase [Methanobrevibacter woesei]PWB87109.1 CAAX amino terminal protease self- immunity [Methanobrevibacter woesei]